MSYTDTFASNAVGMSGPARNAVAITPDNTATLTYIPRGIYVGGGGSISVVLVSGDSASFSNVAAGTILPICPKQVLATGTTASGLIGLY